MAFINLQIDHDQIPQAASLDTEPMAPAYLREVLTQHGITWGILLPASIIPSILVVSPEGLKSALLLLPLALLLLALLLVWLSVKQVRVKSFAMRAHDIAYCSGLFWRKTVLLAFNRIQHIEVSNGPLQRKFGLASLKFFTAGGASVDLSIDGLTAERAEQLREYILQRSAGTTNQQ